MIPSKYQVAIYDSIEDLCSKDSGAIAVEAVAGSGKTTTIVESLKRVPVDFRVLFVAFNKHIAVELGRRVPANVTAQTMNSFGFQSVKMAYKGVQLDTYKTENVLKSLLDMNESKDKGFFYKWKGAISKLVSLARANIIYPQELNESEINDLCGKYDIDLPSNPAQFLQLLDTTYKSCVENTRMIDFDDQIFYPVYYDLAVPQYDLVMVDESQDLNPIQIELIMGASTRFVMVGDSRQAIYGFRGADPRAMKTMIQRTNAISLPLNVCYRCGRDIVAAAKKIVPQIEWSESSPQGAVTEIKHDLFFKDAKDGDYVLCRTTAPLVSNCLKMIREGRKAVVKGRDIGKQLTDLVAKICPDNQTDSKTFYNLLGKYQQESTAKLAKANREAEILNLNDRCDTLSVILEDCEDVSGIKRRIESIFADDNLVGVVFCTVHKSKGLEADTIYILKPSLLPHPSARQEWQIEQERNLKYVAITRAKLHLIWVKD